MKRRWLARIQAALGDRTRTATGAPESYWIDRKADVIGLASIENLRNTRQIDTYRAIHKIIESHEVRYVLDLGCNIAALGLLLQDWGFSGDYCGLDSNPYALTVAANGPLRSNGVCRLVLANIRALPFENTSIDCVVMKDVLEHMEDFRPCLSEAARVARQYVVVANFIPWTEGQTQQRREAAGYYHNLYSRREVYDFAISVGLRVEAVCGTLEQDARANEVVTFSRIN